jgi:protein phosphatase 1L
LQAFYGVYDGHGGRAAVDLIADKLGKNIVAALAAQLELDVMAAIRAGYLATDSEFLSQVGAHAHHVQLDFLRIATS